MVRVPVCPASDGNRFWNSILMVGTSRTQTVPAAPNVNVSGRVEVEVDELEGSVDDVVVTAVVAVKGGDEVVVVGATDEDVVVINGSHASGKVVDRVTDSAPRVYVIVTGPVPADAG